jgi:flagellar hook protein FlgE
MDVIGNNIANVNTVAYKSSRVTFEEAFAQLVQGASRPAGDASNLSGGVNPIQVGLGMNIGSIDLLFTQGNLENTGVTTDLAIQGDAFFVVSDGQRNSFTRSGNFQLDATGRLVSSTNGWVVQGRQVEDGVLTDTIGDIVLPFGQKSPANPTSSVTVGGNLDAEALEGAARDTSIVVYDETGREYEMQVKFVKDAAANTWSYYIGDPTGDPITWDETAGAWTNVVQEGTLVFTDQGQLESVTSPAGTVNTEGDPATISVDLPVDTDTGTMPVEVDFGIVGEYSGLSQFAGASTAVAREQDGYTMGQLERIGIDQTGTITGAFTNGMNLTLGQLVLADFNNPTGLIRSGDNMYTTSANSGAAVLGFAGEGSQSVVTSGALEMSNVDLAQEFTSMITAQRGFQSNARVITSSDEMLQELVNLKR